MTDDHKIPKPRFTLKDLRQLGAYLFFISLIVVCLIDVPTPFIKYGLTMEAVETSLGHIAIMAAIIWAAAFCLDD